MDRLSAPTFVIIVATIGAAAAAAIIHVVPVVVPLAATVPALAPPVAIAAFIHTRTIPAIEVEADGDILYRAHVVEHGA
jgi:hypothetical protein